MTFIRKFSGDRTAPIVCTYTCPEHGEFDAEVVREESGEAPDVIACGAAVTAFPTDTGERVFTCDRPAAWTPSPSIACRVRRIEVARGKWEKPERPTYLDTRKLGEGQSMDEFRAERRKVWEEQRKADVMALKKEI